jgi:hypothetical protein
MAPEKRVAGQKRLKQKYAVEREPAAGRPGIPNPVQRRAAKSPIEP